MNFKSKLYMNFLILFGSIHQGSAVAKIVSVFSLAVILSPFTFLLDKLNVWHLENESYVSFVLGAIFVDHVVGSVYHAYFKRDFSLKKNGIGFVLKVFILVSAMYLFEGLNTLITEEVAFKDYTVMTLRIFVFGYPAGSAIGNIYVMSGKKFPPVSFMDKLKKYTGSTKKEDPNEESQV